MGLHVKAVVVDRKRVFVGSMNLDPRSEELNSEMGVVIDSEPFARQIADIMERDMQPKNAWHVTLNEQGRLRWTADGEPLTRQPARSGWQRMQDVFFMLFPRNLVLTCGRAPCDMRYLLSHIIDFLTAPIVVMLILLLAALLLRWRGHRRSAPRHGDRGRGAAVSQLDHTGRKLPAAASRIAFPAPQWTLSCRKA